MKRIRIAALQKMVFDLSRSIIHMFLLSLISVLLIERIKPPGINAMSSNVAKDIANGPHHSFWHGFLNLFLDVSIEEVIFRIIPFLLFLGFIYILKIKYAKGNCWVVGITSSILFGLVHGNYLNIFIQGVAGLVLWNMMMVTFSTFRWEKSYLMFIFSFLAVILTHFLFDAIIIYEARLIIIPALLNLYMIANKYKWEKIL